jgi:ABC-type nitrate/sulfonate/bicarbonate transport system ATPase subunit
MVTHSIPEAVLLADRVLVLGPSRRAADWPSPPQQRLGMTYTYEFGELAASARQSFEGGLG